MRAWPWFLVALAACRPPADDPDDSDSDVHTGDTADTADTGETGLDTDTGMDTDEPVVDVVIEGTLPAGGLAATHVVAIPYLPDGADLATFANGIVTAPLSGTALSLALSPGHDVVVVLVDETADPEDRVVGHLLLATETEDALCWPTAELRAGDHLVLGTLSWDGPDAVATMASTDLVRPLSVRTVQAAVDEPCRNLVNAWRNLDAAGGTWWTAQPVFTWAQALPTTSPAPDRGALSGWTLAITATDPTMSLASVCDGSTPVTITPPGPLSADLGAGPVTLGPSTPLATTSGPVVSGACQAGDLRVEQTAGGLRLSTPEDALLDVVSGVWTVAVGGTDVAWLDLDLAGPAPQDGPALSATPTLDLDGDGQTLGASLVWREADGPVDPDALEDLVATSRLEVLGITDGFGTLVGTEAAASHPATGSPRVLRTVDLSADDPAWFEPLSAGEATGEAVWTQLAVVHEIADVGHRRVWRATCGPDSDGDGWCDRVDCDDTHPAIGGGPCVALSATTLTAIIADGLDALTLTVDPPLVGAWPADVDCDEVIADLGPFGTDPDCAVDASGATITVSLPSDATLRPGDTVTVPLATSLVTAPGHAPLGGLSALVLPPTQSPTVALVGPTTHVPCQGSLQLTAYAAHAGSRPPTWSWSVEGEGASAGLVAAVDAADTSVLTIDDADLAGVDSLTFTATATTFLGTQGEDDLTVAIQPQAPILTPVGATSLQIQASQFVALQAQVSAPSCPASGAIAYHWSADPPEALPVPSTTPTLALPPGTIEPGSTATYTLTATEDAFGASSTLSWTVEVLRSPLVAVIVGAPGVVVSPLEPFTLDGSDSYDPDDATVPPPGATWQWACQDDLGADCGIALADEAIVALPVPQMAAGVYTITLTFGTPDGRTAYASLALTVSACPVPQLSLFSPDTPNPDPTADVRVLVTNLTNGTIDGWTLTPPPLDPAKVETNTAQTSLILRPGALASGTAYTVRADASNACGGNAFSQLAFTTQ